MTSQHQQQQDQKHFHTMKPTAINLMNLVAILSVLLAVYDGPASARSLNEPTSLLDQDTASNKSTNTTHEDAERFVAKTTSSYELSKQISPVMQLNRLADNSSITCNDGSSIGYYKRLNSHSKSWIIYLQGGGFCHSEDSCQRRWQRNPELMSSLLWPETKSVDGILSSDPKENPYLWNANHIYVPYCSSDSWTGAAKARAGKSSFAFHGSLIVRRVVESLFDDLHRDASLYDAKFVLLAGDSAGASGVIMNLDRINAYIERKTARDTSARVHQSAPVVLRGLADSGWFLDNEPFNYMPMQPIQFDAESAIATETSSASALDCDRAQCSPLQSIRQAMRHWDGQVPEACRLQYAQEPWRCYFGYRAYSTLRTPLFVVQWLYDEAQLLVDNIARPETSDEWDYVNKVARDMRSSLDNVSALFAPSCFAHSLVVHKNWNEININGFKLPHVLNSWEEQSLLEPMAQPRQDAIIAGDSDTMIAAAAPAMAAAPPSLGELRYLTHKPTVSISSSATSQSTRRSRKRKRNNQMNTQRARTHRTRASYESTSVASASNEAQSLQQTQNDRQSRSTLVDDVSAMPPSNSMPDTIDGGRIDGFVLTPSSHYTTQQQQRLYPAHVYQHPSSIRHNTATAIPLARVDDMQFAADAVPVATASATATASAALLQSASLSSNRFSNVDERFRLIDACAWPQCNRDCPSLEIEFGSSGIVALV